MPTLAVMLHILAARPALWVVPAGLLGTAATAIIIRCLPWGASQFYEAFTGDAAYLVTALAITLVGAVLLAIRHRTALSGALWFSSSVAPSWRIDRPARQPRWNRLFVPSDDRDWVGYAAGHELAEIIRDHERDGARLLLWYPTRLGYVDIAWVDLPQNGQTVQELGVPNSLDTLSRWASRGSVTHASPPSL